MCSKLTSSRYLSLQSPASLPTVRVTTRPRTTTKSLDQLPRLPAPSPPHVRPELENWTISSGFVGKYSSSRDHLQALQSECPSKWIFVVNQNISGRWMPWIVSEFWKQVAFLQWAADSAMGWCIGSNVGLMKSENYIQLTTSTSHNASDVLMGSTFLWIDHLRVSIFQLVDSW